MISTGDTAFVLKQRTARTDSAPGPPAPPCGTPVPARHHTLVAAHFTLARAATRAHGSKGRR
jgi:hypothetical protein